MKMTVKNKTITQATSILVLLIAITTIGVYRIKQINRNLTTINDVNAVKQRYAINFRGSVHDRAIRVGDYVLYTDSASKNRTIQEINSLKNFYDESAKAMDEMFAQRTDITEEERAKLADIKKSEAETLPLIQKIIQLDSQGRWDEARSVVLQQARPAFNLWL